MQRKISQMMYGKTFACEKKNLKPIRRFASEALSGYHVPKKDANLMVLALEEVCANLIIHSHQCNPQHSLHIQIDREQDELRFEIFDQGVCFNISEHQEPTISEVISQKKTGGIGLILVKKIMDKIEVKIENGQNIYRFFKAYAV